MIRIVVVGGIATVFSNIYFETLPNRY